MKTPYDDIIHLPHHVSATRKQMSMTDRAAQFSPFAALTGYEAAIAETGRLTDDGFELAADGMELLNGKIQILHEHFDQLPEVTVTWFVPDGRKSGGAYVDTIGVVRRIDSLNQLLTMEDGTAIPFSRIYDIRGGLFEP